MEEPAQVKRCGHCKLEKNVSEFSKNKSKKDGFQALCKDCLRPINNQSYIKNINVRREYLSKNKENIYKKISQRYKYYKQHPDFVDAPQPWYFKRIVKNAKIRKNCPINLTYKELLDFGHFNNCCFCDHELKFTKTHSQSSGNQNGSLDRIDSSRGYGIDNIQWTCWDCNNMKGKIADNKFIQLCNNIAHVNPRPYLVV